jgi:hypothetical protein
LLVKELLKGVPNECNEYSLDSSKVLWKVIFVCIT